jgi:hypothetical protein
MAFTIDGTNGLTFNNATTQASAGCVLQVVNATYSTQVSNSTSTYADTGLTATITPKFSTSKIFIILSHPTCQKSSASSLNDLGMQLVRNSTSLTEFGQGIGYTGTALNLYFSLGYSYLDSPATTSATTYKTQFKNQDNNGAAVFVQTGTINSTSTITLMEIAA